MKEKTMTTKEVAVAMGVRKNLIQEVGKRLFPSRMVNGKATHWTENEVAEISAEVKRTAGLCNSGLPLQKATVGLKPTVAGNSLEQKRPSVQTECTSSLTTDSPNQRLPSTRQELVNNILKAQEAFNHAYAALVANLQVDNAHLTDENAMLKHQVEYNEVIGCSRWSDIKRLLGIRDKWSDVAEELDLEEGVDFFKKCMGYDSYPTTLLPDNTVNRIKEYFKEEY